MELRKYPLARLAMTAPLTPNYHITAHASQEPAYAGEAKERRRRNGYQCPDSTGKCNTATFSKNLSGGFIT
jgi:hypothetical protein